MRLTFRAKLIAIVAVDAFALVALVLLSSLVERRIDRELAAIEQHYVPRIGLKPHLEAGFEKISRSFQDAAAAADLDLLEDVRQQQQALLAEVAAAGDAIEPRDAAAIRLAIDDYVTAASAVTRGLIAGDTGGDTVAGMQAMQEKQTHAADVLDRATRFDEGQLTQAFRAAAEAQRDGARIRLAISAACLVLVLILTIWIGRSLFRTLGELVAGFRRFGDGDFATAIPAVARDELGDVSRQANQMAARLQRLMAERDRSDWLKSGQAGLVESLRGELEPGEVADRAAAFLAGHVGASAALYYLGDGDQLSLLGGSATEPGDGAPPGVRPGDGLIGQAALGTEPTVRDAHVYVPLVHVGAVVGVLELALRQPGTERVTELLLSVRDSITITIEVARARTATRALLAKTQRQAAELLDARAGLLETAEELTRASAYKSQFLANMSHELRTPMNAIIGFSELLHDGRVAIDAEQQKEFLGHIVESGRHLLQLINDVLDLSKVEAGKLDFSPEVMSVERTIHEVVGILRTVAASGRVRIEAEVDPAVDEVALDPARFKQVLYNYLSNAIKFSPEGGQVTVRVLPEDDDRFRLEVADHGVGIGPDDLARLFVEFQQVGTNARRPAGTGLGLALTKRLVEAQGGSVGVRSTVGQGSVFHAVFPRRASTTMVPAARLVGRGPEGAPTVLVIEDNRADQSELAGALSRAGYAVEVATTGTLALARSRERAFDAVTLDLLLPDMTGLEVLRQLRAGGKNQHVPVIVITVVAERGAVAGFAVHDVLPKPLDAELLLLALSRAHVTPGPARNILVVDDDATSRELMSVALKRLGFETRCEGDGAGALRAVQQSAPTAIVLDLLMPGMSGFEFLDQLRGETNGRGVPVIVWTGKDLTRDEHARLRASAHAVVSKGHGGSAGVIAELSAHLPSRPAA